jgi:hypothetical protein
MKSFSCILQVVSFGLLVASSLAFAPSVGSRSSVAVPASSSSFAPRAVLSTTASAPPRRHGTARSELFMGGKMSKFGIFSPAVYVAKLALGTEQLNKLRGKAISLHSQYIGDFCLWAGAYHLRTQLIKKAKTNGDILGFLV